MPRNRKNTEEAGPKAKITANAGTLAKSSKLAASEPVSPIHSAIETIFQNNDAVRGAITANLKKRSAASNAIATRSQVAFSNFSPSKYSAAERARTNYLAPEDDLTKALKIVVNKGVDAVRNSTATRSLRLRSNKDLETLIKANPLAKVKTKGTGNNTLAGTIDLEDLVNYVALKPGSHPSLSNSPVLTSCQAELEVERRLKAIQGDATSAPAAVAPDNLTVKDKPAAVKDLTTTKLVKDNVERQMENATSPEAQLLFSIPQRSDQAARDKNIQTFELRAGPSDVTSYHDFNSLQIAFEHVWTEIFDGQLASLGQELYQEYVKLKVFNGVDDGTDRKISTLDDLNDLMAEIKNLSQVAQDNTPPDLQGGAASSADNIPSTPTQMISTISTVLDPAGQILNAVADKTVQAVVNPAGWAINAIGDLIAGKQQLNWESFPGPLPIGNDVITVSFEEDAVDAGTVEIVLNCSKDVTWWKGIEFTELDAAGNFVRNFRISNDPRDPDVSDANKYNVLPLYTSQLQNCFIEIKKAAILGVHTGFYVLTHLNEKLKDRTRVTFTWIKDH